MATSDTDPDPSVASVDGGAAEHVHEPDPAHDPRDVAHLHEPADFDWVATTDFVPLPNPDVASVEIDGQLLLIHPEAPNVVRLDLVTSVLWGSFGDGVTVGDHADDVADSLDIDTVEALTTMTDTATNLGRSGFLTEPQRPPILRRARVFDVAPDTCAGKKLGLARVDVDGGHMLDLGDQLLRLASTDSAIVDWLGEPFADRLAERDDPRRGQPVELIVANLGTPAPNLRARHRLLDHYGNLWFGTFDPSESADALARVAQDRLDAAGGGTWLRVPVLVPADADTARPVPALALHPWLSLSIDRLLPGLRRAGVAVHPSPLVRYEPANGTFVIAASPRVPAGHVAAHPETFAAAPSTPTSGDRGRSLPTANACTLAPVALVAVWNDIERAQAIELFASSAQRWDQAHLDAVADLTARTPYARLDATRGLRSSAEQLAALLGIG